MPALVHIQWPPPNENQTQAYIQSVASQLCITPDTQVDLTERGVLTIFIKAIIRHENGIQPYSDDIIQQGIDLIWKENGYRSSGGFYATGYSTIALLSRFLEFLKWTGNICWLCWGLFLVYPEHEILG